MLYRSRAVRRMGSAALNLCYVAAGRFDAYWATSVQTWDVAAGSLLVHEAGGVITAPDGAPFDVRQGWCAVAGDPALHRELLEALREA
jgi:myo-inositol-1(or 4)-monophosphatase